MDKQLDLFGDEDFWNYHKENPHIYEAFKSQTIEVIKRGFKNFSADFIVHVLRWETTVKAKHDEYKINNNYRSYYARLFIRDHPQYKGFFRFRTSKANSILKS